MEFSIDQNDLHIEDSSFSFRPRSEQEDRKYSLYLYVEEAFGKLYAKFGEAKQQSVWKRYSSVTGNSANKRMTHLWESDKGDKEIHAVLRDRAKNDLGFKWSGDKEDSAVNSNEAYEILSLKGFENLVSIISKEADSTPLTKSYRGAYEDISTLVSEILKKHKHYEKFNLDLCTRWGKTSTILETLRRSKYQVCFMCSYIGTVRTSYKSDIDTLLDYENLVFIDPDNFETSADCIKSCKKAIKDGKKIMYYIALTGTYNNGEMEDSEEALDTFKRRTEGISKLSSFNTMMVIEEADFGAHCENQISKIKSAYKSAKCDFFIATTGTNAEKSEAIFPSDCYIKRDYMLDVLTSSCRKDKEGNDTAVGIEWNILNNSGMVNCFEYQAEEMENFSDMMEVIDGHLKNEAYFREVLKFLFGHQLASTREARKFKNLHLLDDEAATMIFTPTGYDTHKALAKLIEEEFPGKYLVKIIDGLETTNADAEKMAKDSVKDANSTHRQAIFIASGMANRSFSVGQIKNVILFTDAGSYASVAQKIARGLTPWNSEHRTNHIIDFRLGISEDFCLREYLSGLGQTALDGSTSTDVKELIDTIDATEKLTFNEYFDAENPIKKLSKEELDVMMRTTSFDKKLLAVVYDDIEFNLPEPKRCGINETEDKTKAIFNTSYKGDKSKSLFQKTPKNASKEEREQIEEMNKKRQHLLFLINNFEAYFNTYSYSEDILKHEFEDNMSKSRKQALEEEFEIDMDFICKLAKSFIKNSATAYFDKISEEF